jgi:hypothetical protein
MQKISMRIMDLDDIKTSRHSSFSCINERRNDSLYTFQRQLLWLRIRRWIISESYSRRSQNIIRSSTLFDWYDSLGFKPWSRSGGFPTCMNQLNGDLLILRVYELDDVSERFDVCVRPDSTILR